MIRITIDNKEVLCSNDFTIEEEFLNTSSVILNNVMPKEWDENKTYTDFYHFKDFSKCLIYNDNDLLFCGVVKNSGNISLNPRHPHYSALQILDFKTFLSNGETLDYVIADKTVEQAIYQVVGSISDYGFIVGNIDIDGAYDEIGAYSTKEKTAYDVFNYLADITQSRWTTRMVDENTVAIDFYDPDKLPSGLQIDYTDEWFEENEIQDITYSYGTNDYRNKQIMTSEKVYGNVSQQEQSSANGYQTQYTTYLPIGNLEKILVNGVQKSFTTNDEKELGTEADFYFTPGDTFFSSDEPLSTGSVIVVVYTPIVRGRQIVTNADEISRVSNSTGRKGVVSRYENRNDATTTQELQKIGESYIKYKGVPEINLTVISNKNIWNVGDSVYFDAPIEELKTNYMVKKKEISRILANPNSDEFITYTYTMTSSFNAESEINYFDNQRAKTNGNIGQGEFIPRNYDIENTAKIIFYEFLVEQAEITGNNVLNATLDAPLTQ